MGVHMACITSGGRLSKRIILWTREVSEWEGMRILLVLVLVMMMMMMGRKRR